MKGIPVPLLDRSSRVSKRYDQKHLTASESSWKPSCSFHCVMAYSNNSMSRNRDRGDSRAELFQTLEFKESRKRSLWMSVVVHGVLLSVLLAIPLIFTETMKVKFSTVEIVPPMPK